MKTAFKSVIMIAVMINFNSISPAARYTLLDEDPIEISVYTPAKPIKIPVKIDDPYKKIRTKIFKALKASDSSHDIQFKAGEVPIFSGDGNLTHADMEAIRSVTAINPTIRFKSRRK